MVTEEEVPRTEIRMMVEQSVTFLNIASVDDKFRDNKSISKHQEEASELDKSLWSSKIPTMPTPFADHIPKPAEDNFPVILKDLMLIIALIHCRQISTKGRHISLKYWFRGTGCRWKPSCRKSLPMYTLGPSTDSMGWKPKVHHIEIRQQVSEVSLRQLNIDLLK